MTPHIEKFRDWLIDFLGLCGREVIVDSFAEVTRFPNELLKTNLAKVVFAARRVV